MAELEGDPLGTGGIAEFAARFRAGGISAEAATRAYLRRIEAVDGRLGAFQHVAGEQALATARAIDALFAAGTDLGPLMGVPVAVKDLFVVDGMPTTAGTKLDVADLLGSGEGPVVKALRRAGCVILGKTKTVEFALGITGVSQPRGTPRNPWDADTARLPGGSSSGSGVATAAGLCAFAIGSDTGGSVRVPAAFNGTFGLKASFGVFSNEGGFALARHLDTIGLLTRSAADAALVFEMLTGDPVSGPLSLAGLRLGRPENYFFEGLEPQMERRVGETLDLLAGEGAHISGLEIPEAPERETYFPVVLPVCLLSELGLDRFEKGRGEMDPIVAQRARSGLEVRAFDYQALERRREASLARAHRRFAGLDAWVSPTTALSAPPASEIEDAGKAFEFALGMTRNTQPANYLDLCAVNVPLPVADGALPAGFQIMCPPGSERRLLAMALALEARLGRPRLPDVSAFAPNPVAAR